MSKLFVTVNVDRDSKCHIEVLKGDEVFTNSPYNISLPERPYYNKDCEYSCKESVYNKWKKKVEDKIIKQVNKELGKRLYGDYSVEVNFV